VSLRRNTPKHFQPPKKGGLMKTEKTKKRGLKPAQLKKTTGGNAFKQQTPASSTPRWQKP